MQRFIALLAILAVFSTSPALAEEKTDFVRKTELNKMIYDYLMENPEVIMESVAKKAQREQEKENEAAQANIDKNADFLYNSDVDPMIGNPNGDVTVVEFFDYNCGYCRKTFADLIKLTEEDPDVRIVFKELPILSDASREAARWALAAKMQDRYFDFHSALMKHNGRISQTAVSSVAAVIGLDIDRLKKDLENPEIEKIIDGNIEKAREMTIRGTPAIVVDGKLLRGASGLESIKEAIAATRKKNEAAKKD